MTKFLFVFIAVLFAGIAVASGASAADDQIAKTPCGEIRLETLQAVDIAVWRRQVATVEACTGWYERARRIEIEQGTFALRNQLAGREMSRLERNDERRYSLADRQMAQAERDAEVRRELAYRQMAAQERALDWGVRRDQIGTMAGTVFIARRILGGNRGNRW